MRKEVSVYNNLIDLYEKNVFELSPEAVLHFFHRVYITNGNKKYTKMIATGVYIKYIKEFELLVSKLDVKDYNLRDSSKKLKKMGERQRKRKNYYKSHPEIHFFNRLFLCLFYIKKFNLHQGCRKDSFIKAINLLKKIDFKNIYLSDEAIKGDSSYLFNSVVFMKQLGVNSALENQCIQRLRDLYIDSDLNIKNNLDESEFQSLIYSLTHIIIADSRFYERFVFSYDWIIDVFIKNLEEIEKRVTFDILSEIAFCLRLTQQSKRHEKEYKLLKKNLLKMIQFYKLNNDITYLKFKEHTNSILILLFGAYKDFEKPVNLSKNKLFSNQ